MLKFLLDLAELTLSMSAVILLCFAMMRLWGGKFSAKCRYAVWAVVIIRLCVPVGMLNMPTLVNISVPSSILGQTASVDGSIDAQESAGETAPDIGGSVSSVGGQSSADGQSGYLGQSSYANQADTDKTMESDEQMGREPVSSGESFGGDPSSTQISAPTEKKVTLPYAADALIFIWAAGAVLYFSVTLAQNILMIRFFGRKKKLCGKEISRIYGIMCRKYGFKHSPRLYLCPNIESPMLCGFLKPMILLPDRALSEQAVVGVLAHELTHYGRGDIWMKLICLAAQSLGWFNPLVHMAASRCTAEMELSCDETVLAGADEDIRRSYGRIMLDIIRNSRQEGSVLTTHFNPQKRAVKERFVNILDMNRKRRGVGLVALALAVCILSGVIFGCDFARVSAATPEPTEAEKAEGSVPSPKPPEAENALHIAESTEELTELGLPENDPRLRFIAAFVTGDTDALEELYGVSDGVCEGYRELKIRQWRAYTVPDENDPGSLIVRFGFFADEVGELNFTAGQWNGDFNIYEIVNGIYLYKFRERDHGEVSPYPGTSAGVYAYVFLSSQHFCNFSELYGDGEAAKFALNCYILRQFDLESVSQSEAIEYAEEHFGLSYYDPGQSHRGEDGEYTEGGHCGTSQVLEFAGEKRLSEDLYEVTFQFYADYSKTVKSHRYSYTVRQIGEDFVFDGCTPLYIAPNEPYRN